jgi:hypothetical protein
MRAKVLLLATLLLLSLLPLGLPTVPAPPGLPSLSVDVDDVGEVDSDPVEYNHVPGKAVITVTNFPLGATVKVNASTNSGWMVTVEPESFDVPQGTTSHTEDINLDIRVPPRASAENPTELKVFCNTTGTIGWEYFGEGYANLTVTQYYGVRLGSNGTVTVKQGGNDTQNIRITNTGNGVDNYTVQLDNEATLSTKGLEVEYDGTVFAVGKDRMVTDLVTVTASEDAPLGITEALFTIRSKGETSVSATYKLTITVTKGDDGGNGANGGDGTDDEGSNATGMYVLAGILVVIVIAIIMFFGVVKRRTEESEASGDRRRDDDRI